MILADTAIWIDHIARPDAEMRRLLLAGQVVGHPMVIGGLAMRDFRGRSSILDDLARLPSAPVGFHAEVLGFVERHGLFGSGIGYIDAHLLVSTQLMPRGRLWTRDKRLRTAASRLGVAADDLA